MSWVKCGGCNQVMVPAENTRCLDCWCTDRQERERYVWELNQRLESARYTERKLLAAAAIATADMQLSREMRPTAPDAIATRAFEIADAMMAKSVFPIPAPKEIP